ncbi:hypothetical protein D3C87_1645570 [compost metagenome]
MVNLTTALMKRPILRVATPASLAAAIEGTATSLGLESTMNRLEKSMPPMMRPMSGMKISSTIEETMAPKAAPMITPIARSIMLPLMAKSRNSLKTLISTLALGPCNPTQPAGTVNRT